MQRRGRAGRVGPGLTFVVYPRNWWENDTIPAEGLSEMQRSPLERTVLQSLQLDGFEDPESLLLSAMDPPESQLVRSAVQRLGDVGAVILAPVKDRRDYYARCDINSHRSPLTYLGLSLIHI